MGPAHCNQRTRLRVSRFGAASPPVTGGIVNVMMFSDRLQLAMFVLIAALLRSDALVALQQGQRRLTIAVSPEAISPGDVVRIDVSGAPDERITATVFDQNLTFSFDAPHGTWTTLAGVDLETKPGAYRLRVERDGTQVTTHTIRVLAKQFRIRRLRVPDTFVNPTADALDQIARDTQALRDVYARATPQRWAGAFLVPVSGAPTSNFGTRSYYNGRQRSPHAGVDFMSEPGTPIHASNHGTVALAAPLYFTGNTVIIDYGARLFSVFAHLSEFRVQAGEIVTPEAIVGLVGATGRVTGPHLHWSVRLNGARVDPLSLITATRQ